MALRAANLCSGYRGFELGLRLAGIDGYGQPLTGAVQQWATPKATDANTSSPADFHNRKAPGLRAQATQTDGVDGQKRADLNPQFVATLMGVPKDWLTPTGADSKASGGAVGSANVTLTDAAIRRQWATPRASMNENRTTKHAPSHGNGHGETLAGQAAGLRALTIPTDGDDGQKRADLNPQFVATLMGVPKDWLTPSTSVATDSYQSWLALHSSCLRNALGFSAKAR